MKLHEIIKEEFKVSTEAIDPQDKSFFNGIVNEIRKMRSNGVFDIKTFEGFSNIVKNYTGMNIFFWPIKDYTTLKEGVLNINYRPEHLNKNHVLTNFLYSVEKIVTKDYYKNKNLQECFPDGIKGTVNLDKNTVEGDYKKIVSHIAIPTICLSDPYFTDEELAAAIMHEIGHAFMYLASMDNVVTTNAVLAGLLGILTKTDDLKKRTTALQLAYEKLNIQERAKEIEDTAKAKNEVAMQIFIQKTITRNRSLSDSKNYDITAYEQSADQYALRCGAGAHLASFFDKSTVVSGVSIYRNKVSYHAAELLTMSLHYTERMFRILGDLIVVGTVVGIVGFLTGTLSTGMALSIFSITMRGRMVALIGLCTGIASEVTGKYFKTGPRYDQDKNRLLRMKEDLINQLKYTNRKDRFYIDILDDIRVIEKIIQQYQSGGFIEKIYNALRFAEEKKHRELESLAANDLFVLGNEFKYNKS